MNRDIPEYKPQYTEEQIINLKFGTSLENQEYNAPLDSPKPPALLPPRTLSEKEIKFSELKQKIIDEGFDEKNLKGFSVNSVDESHKTLSHYAIEFNRLEYLQKLLAKNAENNGRNFVSSLIKYTAICNNKKCFDVLKAKKTKEFESEFADDLVFYAVLGSSYGHDENIPLENSRQKDRIELLNKITNGKNDSQKLKFYSTKDSSGLSVFQYACQKGYIQVAKHISSELGKNLKLEKFPGQDFSSIYQISDYALKQPDKFAECFELIGLITTNSHSSPENKEIIKSDLKRAFKDVMKLYEEKFQKSSDDEELSRFKYNYSLLLRELFKFKPSAQNENEFIGSEFGIKNLELHLQINDKKIKSLEKTPENEIKIGIVDSKNPDSEPKFFKFNPKDKESREEIERLVSKFQESELKMQKLVAENILMDRDINLQKMKEKNPRTNQELKENFEKFSQKMFANGLNLAELAIEAENLEMIKFFNEKGFYKKQPKGTNILTAQDKAESYIDLKRSQKLDKKTLNLLSLNLFANNKESDDIVNYFVNDKLQKNPKSDVVNIDKLPDYLGLGFGSDEKFKELFAPIESADPEDPQKKLFKEKVMLSCIENCELDRLKIICDSGFRLDSSQDLNKSIDNSKLKKAEIVYLLVLNGYMDQIEPSENLIKISFDVEDKSFIEKISELNNLRLFETYFLSSIMAGNTMFLEKLCEKCKKLYDKYAEIPENIKKIDGSMYKDNSLIIFKILEIYNSYQERALPSLLDIERNLLHNQDIVEMSAIKVMKEIKNFKEKNTGQGENLQRLELEIRDLMKSDYDKNGFEVFKNKSLELMENALGNNSYFGQYYKDKITAVNDNRTLRVFCICVLDYFEKYNSKSSPYSSLRSSESSLSPENSPRPNELAPKLLVNKESGPAMGLK